MILKYKLINIFDKLQYLGLIGFLGMALENDILYLFIFFWLFGLASLIMSLPIVLQSIYILIGMLYIKLKKKAILSIDNYICEKNYIQPFEGKATVVNGGVSKKFSHSWEAFSQRYAYDFVILDSEGHSYNGNIRDVESYYCYGINIISPSDGEVVEVKSQYNNSWIDRKKAYCHCNDIRGNYIIIKHSDNEYSALCHLMPNSIKVKTGDKVRQGEVIAKCGNTGNSSEPHLHYQLQTGKNFFTAIGVPISFTNIKSNISNNYKNVDQRETYKQVINAKKGVYIGSGLEVENLK